MERTSLTSFNWFPELLKIDSAFSVFCGFWRSSFFTVRASKRNYFYLLRRNKRIKRTIFFLRKKKNYLVKWTLTIFSNVVQLNHNHKHSMLVDQVEEDRQYYFGPLVVVQVLEKRVARVFESRVVVGTQAHVLEERNCMLHEF